MIRHHRIVRLVIPLLLLPAVGSAIATSASPAGSASALCIESPLAGDWRNVDAATRSITRVVVTQDCDDVRMCPVGGPCTGGTGASFEIATYGKCHPTDCAWGTVPAVDAGGGWLQATYSFGFMTSHIWVKTYAYYGLTYLRVWVYNDFTPADGRADYTSDEWFLM